MEEETGKPQSRPVQEKKPLLKKFPKPSPENLWIVLGSVLIVVAGIGTGWLFSGRAQKGTAVSDVAPGGQKTQMEAGVEDTQAFPDIVEGVLEEGGIEGEGTYHLVRDGGPSQNVYLTSTIIDLQSFVGKKVKVWGETMSAQTAGWLMDVGKIKVLE